nr:hypothetical protein [Tanacetum cinerariifolium]
MGIGINQKEVNKAVRHVGCSMFSTPFNYLGVKVGGRLTLIKFVFTSIPLYYMSISKVPIGVLDKFESIRRNFFNGVDGPVRKTTRIGWNKVLESKKMKAKFITTIHGVKGALDVTNILVSRFVWLDIIRSLFSLKNKGIDLMTLISRKVGNREDTKFWEDIWLNDVAFKVKFQRIYALELDKNVNVADKKKDPFLALSYCRTPR